MKPTTSVADGGDGPNPPPVIVFLRLLAKLAVRRLKRAETDAAEESTQSGD